MELLKLNHPVVFLAAQAKCGKGYISGMVRHALYKKTSSGGMECHGRSTHEYIMRSIPQKLVWGISSPLSKLCTVYPIYNAAPSLEEAMEGVETLWLKQALPYIEEHTQKGPVIDCESRFLYMYYFLAKKYIHPDSMKILVMKRPLASIAYQHCRASGYKIVKRHLGTKKAVLPWGRLNLTQTPYEINTVTQQELCVWYTFEMEERKKKLKGYFPDVGMLEWDMETDPPDLDKWDRLLKFFSAPTRQLQITPKMKRFIGNNNIIHPGPNRCYKVCPNKEPCTEDLFVEMVNDYKVIHNTEVRPEYLF